MSWEENPPQKPALLGPDLDRWPPGLRERALLLRPLCYSGVC